MHVSLASSRCLFGPSNLAWLYSATIHYWSDILLELSNSHQVQLLVYFMLKYAMEIVLAESSLITGYYFIWSTSSVAIFLACLGLTVLPVNVLVGSYISNIFEER